MLRKSSAGDRDAIFGFFCYDRQTDTKLKKPMHDNPKISAPTLRKFLDISRYASKFSLPRRTKLLDSFCTSFLSLMS
ncbi:MAG: hypothetical protein A3C13_01980 [Candidatus Lloydbacteria bacterium RIFCSPHIGHO2_02_FULL_50_11]|nr:MAG: hypothetical protein A3C13_01980 [Candidatus Lloydbacteria bacterium RIFCSPHIGHO2_02_FULL_50_11]